MAKQKTKKAEASLSDVLAAIQGISEVTTMLSQEINELKKKVNTQEDKEATYGKLSEEVDKRRNNYNFTTYKVLKVKGEYQDDYTGEIKKSYYLPGNTFKNRESAMKYINAQSNPSAYELVPL